MSAPADDPFGRTLEPKAWFYLDHRAEIEEWATLRPEAARVLDDALRSRLPALGERLAGELAEASQEAESDEDDTPRVGFYKSEWDALGVDLAVRFTWSPDDLLDPRTVDQDPWLELRAFSSPAPENLVPVARAVRGIGRSSGGPLAWESVHLPTHAALDLDAYVEHAYRHYLNFWQRIDAALEPLLRG